MNTLEGRRANVVVPALFKGRDRRLADLEEACDFGLAQIPLAAKGPEFGPKFINVNVEKLDVIEAGGRSTATHDVDLLGSTLPADSGRWSRRDIVCLREEGAVLSRKGNEE